MDKVIEYIQKYVFDRSLKEKWVSDQVALDISPKVQKLYMSAHRFHYSRLAKFPNLISPTSFNDRIHWLMLFDQDRLHLKCTDKFEVRRYVEERVGSKYLTKLHGIFESAAELIDYDFPDSFAVKATHDSGTVFLVPNKDKFNKAEILGKLDQSLKVKYGIQKGEWPYGLLKPRIILEEHLTPQLGISPSDFKFHCVEGKVAFIQYIFDRENTPKEILFDSDWNVIPIRLHFELGDIEVPKPHALEEMISIAEELSSPFKYVRVDLYDIAGRTVFGELTFFPMAGVYVGYGVYQLGDLMSFDISHRKPPISDGVNLF